MRKPVVAVLVGLSLFSQASFAGSRGDIEAWIEHLSDGSTAVPHQSLEEIRPESDSSFWKSVLSYSNEVKSRYVDGINGQRTLGTAAAISGVLAVGQSAAAEAAMRIYGTQDPIAAMKLMAIDIYSDLPRLSIRRTVPGSPQNLKFQNWINRMDAIKASQLSGVEARLLRTATRGMGIAGVGLVAGGVMIVNSSRGTSQDSFEMADGFENPNEVIELLASEKSNAEILEMAQKDEALRLGIQAAAEKMHALEMWAEISQ